MYGRTFAEAFPFRYTRKYWTVEPDQLGVDWIGSRMQQPSLAEMVRGALDPPVRGDFHYVSTVRYPRQGGFASFLGALDPGASFRPGRQVVAVDVAEQRLRFADGSSDEYSDLVSTMPLDLLVSRLEGVRVPDEVRDAGRALLCTSVVLVDVCVDRSDLFDHEWFYVYDEDISFSRAHLPSLLAPGMSPAGQSSVQVEVYHSRTRPLEDAVDALPDRVVGELIRMGLVRSRSEVVATRARDVTHANVVFDHARADALAVIKPFIADLGIVLAGRYGEWEYQWTDDAARSGWRAAAAVAGESLPVGGPR
jgi:protoporphyrinogen oxidase